MPLLLFFLINPDWLKATQISIKEEQKEYASIHCYALINAQRWMLFGNR